MNAALAAPAGYREAYSAVAQTGHASVDAARAAADDRARAELDALFGAPATGVAGPGPKKPGG